MYSRADPGLPNWMLRPLGFDVRDDRPEVRPKVMLLQSLMSKLVKSWHFEVTTLSPWSVIDWHPERFMLMSPGQPSAMAVSLSSVRSKAPLRSKVARLGHRDTMSSMHSLLMCLNPQMPSALTLLNLSTAVDKEYGMCGILAWDRKAGGVRRVKVT